MEFRAEDNIHPATLQRALINHFFSKIEGRLKSGVESAS